MSDAIAIFAIYKAKPKRDQELKHAIKAHAPLLRRLGFATNRPTVILKSTTDETYIEVFEWVSSRTIDEAHSNPEVKAMWDKFDDLADMKMLKDLSEASTMFPGFLVQDDLIN